MEERTLSLVLSAVMSVLSVMSGGPREDIPDKGFFTAADDILYIDGEEYQLTFDDEFEGTQLDTSKWERCPEQRRQDLNNYWDDSMSYLDGEGDLVIGIDLDKGRYISGGIRSKGKFEQAYGYYEIRCTLNNIPGYWTAFWLFNDCVTNEAKGGRNGTEIDIYESPYYDSKEIQHTLNWDGHGSAHKSEGKVVSADVYDGEFHTFGLLWTQTEYVFYIDGQESWCTDAKAAQGTCEEPLYIKVTAETGSWVPHTPVATKLPDHIKVDYVRAYSKKDD